MQKHLAERTARLVRPAAAGCVNENKNDRLLIACLEPVSLRDPSRGEGLREELRMLSLRARKAYVNRRQPLVTRGQT